jgi:hypothetical protein
MARTCSVLLSTFLLACGGTLPEPIYANQVDAYFPAPADDAPDRAAQEAVRDGARRCAARLNGRRSSAETGSIVQSILNGFTGVTSGVGGALAAVDFGNPDITTAMGVMASIGAGLNLVGNLVMGLAANPLEELRRHSLALRSWEVAVELRAGNADNSAVEAMLERCNEDQAPPARAAGEGAPFSL